MKAPKITVLKLGYNYEWEEHGIRVEVRRLDLSHQAELKGEIGVYCNKIPGASHLMRGTFNFSATGTRDKLATTLNKRYETDWVAILEQVCWYTTEYSRKGDAAVELVEDDYDELLEPPPEYLLSHS